MTTTTSLLCNKFGGIRQRNAQFTEDLITAQDIQNVELYYTGVNGGVGIRTMKGNVSITDALAGEETIIKIYESVQQNITYCFVHTENDTEGKLYLYSITSNTFTIIKDGLTLAGVSNGFDIAQGWSDLFFFTNGYEMFTVELNPDTSDDDDEEETDDTDTGSDSDTDTDSDTTSTIAFEVVDMTDTVDRDGRSVLSLGAALFNGRLWLFNGNVLWYSVTSDIYDFSTAESEWITTAGYIEPTKNITAIHEYLGSLAVFYKDSSQLLSVDEDDGSFSLSDDSPGGCAGFDALVFHDTNLYFYDDTKKSVFSFQQVVSGEKTLGENTAVEIQDELDDIDSTQLEKVTALSVFLEGRNEIWWLIPTSDEDYSTVLIYDYLKGEWVKRKEQKINSMAIVNSTLYSAGNDGRIYEEYVSDTFNGEYIQHYYECSPFNLGAMNTLKIFYFPPRVTYDLPYSNKYYVKYVKNFNTFKTPKVKYIKTKYKNYLYWDTGYWDSTYYWFSGKTGNIGRFPNATFKVLEMTIYTTNEEENFSIKNIEFSKIKVKQV